MMRRIRKQWSNASLNKTIVIGSSSMKPACARAIAPVSSTGTQPISLSTITRNARISTFTIDSGTRKNQLNFITWSMRKRGTVLRIHSEMK